VLTHGHPSSAQNGYVGIYWRGPDVVRHGSDCQGYWQYVACIHMPHLRLHAKLRAKSSRYARPKKAFFNCGDMRCLPMGLVVTCAMVRFVRSPDSYMPVSPPLHAKRAVCVNPQCWMRFIIHNEVDLEACKYAKLTILLRWLITIYIQLFMWNNYYNTYSYSKKLYYNLFNKLSLSYNVKLNTIFPSTDCAGLRLLL